MPFLAHLYDSTGSYCCHSDVGIGVGVTLKSFMLEFFYVMGKALSGKLSCTGTGLVVSSFHIMVKQEVGKLFCTQTILIMLCPC